MWNKILSPMSLLFQMALNIYGEEIMVIFQIQIILSKINF